MYLMFLEQKIASSKGFLRADALNLKSGNHRTLADWVKPLDTLMHEVRSRDNDETSQVTDGLLEHSFL
jgi:hypothetical protein